MSKKNSTINKKDNSKIVNIFIIVGIIFLIGSLVLMFTVNNDSSIKDISFKEYKDKIKEDKYNVFILTSPTCTHCNNYKPYVNYVAKENNIKVYNINLSNLEYNEYIELHDTYSILKNEYGSDNNPVIPTPVTIITKNGQEIASSLGDIGQKGFTSLLKNNNVIQ